jgi:hypothetical protein
VDFVCICIGVESVWASPEQGLVVVHGTADAWALSRRIRRKLKRHADVVSDGSAPYYGSTDAPYYRPSEPYYGPSEPYGYGAAPPQDYYSHRQHGHYSYPSPPRHGHYSYPSPPRHGYYSHPPPQPGYSYAAGGYDRWAADPDPYGYGYGYAAQSSAPACSIM